MDESRKQFEELMKGAGFKHLVMDWDSDSGKYRCPVTQRAFTFWNEHGPDNQEK